MGSNMEKLISALLVFVLGGTFTANYRIGEVSSTTEKLSEILIDTRSRVDTYGNELIAIKAQNSFMINEQAELKPIVHETRAEQISRQDEIDCIDKIRDVLGCNIPRNHGVTE